jgi:hypothetical protein
VLIAIQIVGVYNDTDTDVSIEIDPNQLVKIERMQPIVEIDVPFMEREATPVIGYGGKFGSSGKFKVFLFKRLMFFFSSLSLS